MSSHYIYVSCTVEGCPNTESIYTGDAYTDLFNDSGPDSWEGETIKVLCKAHIAIREGAVVGSTPEGNKE